MQVEGERVQLGPSAVSSRELEVLRLLAQGLRGTEIADDLHVSPETVRTHVRNAMKKLPARTRVQAVAIVVEYGLASTTSRTPTG